jgi:hypothetical protein
VHFDLGCKKYGGDLVSSLPEHVYPRNPPFINGLSKIETDSPETAERLAKAFSHAAALFQAMPKARSNEPF